MTLTLLLTLLTLGAPQESAEEPRAEVAHIDDYVPCGTTSLYLIARLRDCPVTFEGLVKSVGPMDKDKTHSFSDLISAAKQIGLSAIALDVNRETLSQLPMPAILRVKNSRDPKAQPHLLVLISDTKNGLYLLDPPFRPFYVTNRRFLAEWDGKIVVFPRNEAETISIVQLSSQSKVYDLMFYSLLSVCILTITALTMTRQVIPKIRTKYTTSKARVVGLSTALVICLAISVPIRMNYDPQRPNYFAACCHVETDEKSLGELPTGNHETQLTITNTGSRQLAINRVTSSCSCASTKLPSTIDPGQSANLTVNLNVTPGPRSAEIIIQSNDPEGEKRVYLNWYGCAKPAMIPRYVSFDSKPVGTVVEQVVKLVFPGGRKAPVPELLEVDSNSRFVKVTSPPADPIALRLTTIGKVPVVQGEKNLHVQVESPPNGGRIETVAKMKFLYLGNRIELEMPIVANFYGNHLVPDVESVLFANSSAGALVGQERLIKVRCLPEDEIVIRNVPEWLHVSIARESDNIATLRIRVSRLPDLIGNSSITLETPGKESATSIGVQVFSLQ